MAEGIAAAVAARGANEVAAVSEPLGAVWAWAAGTIALAEAAKLEQGALMR